MDLLKILCFMRSPLTPPWWAGWGTALVTPDVVSGSPGSILGLH